MNTEIVYVCNSKNNKNIRANELKILEKNEKELYFSFGESNVNEKKRFYDDIETLNKDFEAVLKIKNNLEKQLDKKPETELENDEKKPEAKRSTVKSSTKRFFPDIADDVRVNKK